MSKSPLAPLAPVFQALNWVAFGGWSYVFLQLFKGCDAQDMDPYVKYLEGICLVEVLRIMVGDLKGNLKLGLFLHAIRLGSLFAVIPRLPEGHWTQDYIYFAYSVAEVTRYPMYLFPSSNFIRQIRMVAPLFTFPVGCYTEGLAAYIVLLQEKEEGAEKHPVWLVIVLAFILFVNGVLGPTQAMPALIQKGFFALGISKPPPPKQKEVKRI
ncbi:unnamed protein product [Cylindrotheca closterium]|uniref:very-long-chain (3R)-3-hydroxyacyl-CoA dehydratase n=1 Tax=Cylindrotheca closterium TaxID=2856 RepID=A0AAD2CWN9_9STRA|nr:unnamed protein product [Cylindrotheca closterium]